MWRFEPVTIAAALAICAAYARRARRLSGRGQRVPIWKQAAFCLGIGALLVSLISPIDTLGESRLFYAHMVQHLLIGEVAPLLIVLGLSGPLLRPLLALPAIARLRWLLNPLVALPLWVFNLYVWHLPGLYEAALRSDLLHLLEHGCFFWAGIFMWGALIEPLPGPSWFSSGAKMTYVLVVRALGCAILGNVFIWEGTPFYPYYAVGERESGIASLTDQQVGGAIMFIWGALITVSLFSWLFLRWLRDAELRQSLLEGGADARAATRAARYGRRPLARPVPPPSP